MNELCNASIVVRRRRYVCTQTAGHTFAYHVCNGRASWSSDGEQFFLAPEEVIRRYPRLLASVKWCIIGTNSEARSAIEGYINGYGGSEAVQHFGGCHAAVRGGIRARHALRKLYPGYLNHLLPPAELQAA